MNATETQRPQGAVPGAFPLEAGGRSIAQAVGAIAAVVLAIVGLAGIDPNLLAAIAVLVVGAAILAHGWFGTSRYPQYSAASTTAANIMGADVLGGMAGIVLGILTLLLGDAGQLTLLAVALLVYGAALLMSIAALAQLRWRSQIAAQAGSPASTSVVIPAVQSGYLLVGLGALTLGILAVIGLVPVTLILVGLLSLGVAMALSQFFS